MTREIWHKSKSLLGSRTADTRREISSAKEAMEQSCGSGTHTLMSWLEQRAPGILSPTRDEARGWEGNGSVGKVGPDSGTVKLGLAGLGKDFRRDLCSGPW